VTILQALILGFIQGLTEFIPVSSSGHLVLGQRIFNFKAPPIIFDILVHVATLGAIIIFFRKELISDTKDFFKAIFQGNIKKIPKICWLVIIGTIPAAAIGFLLEPFLGKIFNSTILVGFSLILTSILLFSENFLKKQTKKITSTSGIDALIIGSFQALAILPGVSRSGSTIIAGLWRKLKKEDAFKFSFYLAIPAIIGAQALEIRGLFEIRNGGFIPHFIGFITAFLTGILALKFLKKMVISKRLAYFGIYCFLIGSLAIILSL